jgi:hypothetical protein
MDTEGADGTDIPIALRAVTVNVYRVPFVRPVTVQGGLDVLHVAPPGLAVATYSRTGEPPSSVGGIQDTVTCLLPADPVALLGGCGTVATKSAAVWLPPALIAVTVLVLMMPEVSTATGALASLKLLAVPTSPATLDPQQ